MSGVYYVNGYLCYLHFLLDLSKIHTDIKTYDYMLQKSFQMTPVLYWITYLAYFVTNTS